MKQDKDRFAFSVVYRLILTAVCCTGLYFTAFAVGGFMSTSMLVYYTTQSNIWVLLVTLLFLALSIAERASGRTLIGNALRIVKFVVVVAISITFLVFWAMLAPTMDPGYLLTVSNLCVHTLTPILIALDFFIFDKAIVLKKRHLLWATVPPLYYLTFALIRAELGGELRGGSRYPYWFMDVDRFGWFRIGADGVGLFWWVMVLLLMILGFAALYRLIMLKLQKRRDA